MELIKQEQKHHLLMKSIYLTQLFMAAVVVLVFQAVVVQVLGLVQIGRGNADMAEKII